MNEPKMLTVEETAQALKKREIGLDSNWIRKKAATGNIEGAVKMGSKRGGFWLIPEEWAQTYTKDTRGRPRRAKKDDAECKDGTQCHIKK